MLLLICLVAGAGSGWFIRGFQKPAVTGSVAAASVSSAVVDGNSPASQPSGMARLEDIADAQAAPLLAKLKSNPNDPGLLARLGNLYYDAQQYPSAIQFYSRVLAIRPADAAVRTDMGTAYWYMGNPDLAIAQFDKALAYAPNNPNTLFNRGLVKWKGKKDGAGAIADWNQLLSADPNYDGKQEIDQLMAEVRSTQRSARN
jgi:tetratricopeptide (TPR) repeat protein